MIVLLLAVLVARFYFVFRESKNCHKESDMNRKVVHKSEYACFNTGWTAGAAAVNHKTS